MPIDTLQGTEAYRLLRIAAVCAVSGQARSTLYRRVTDGLWPSPVKLGPRSVGWPAAEIAALNGARIAGRNNDEIRALVKNLEAARRGVDGTEMASALANRPPAPAHRRRREHLGPGGGLHGDGRGAA